MENAGERWDSLAASVMEVDERAPAKLKVLYDRYCLLGPFDLPRTRYHHDRHTRFFATMRMKLAEARDCVLLNTGVALQWEDAKRQRIAESAGDESMLDSDLGTNGDSAAERPYGAPKRTFSESIQSNAEVATEARGERSASLASRSGLKLFRGGRGGKQAKRPRRRTQLPKGPRQCLWCGATETLSWRTGPDNQRSLCQPCGLHYLRGHVPGEGFHPSGAKIWIDTATGRIMRDRGPARRVDPKAVKEQEKERERQQERGWFGDIFSYQAKDARLFVFTKTFLAGQRTARTPATPGTESPQFTKLIRRLGREANAYHRDERGINVKRESGKKGDVYPLEAPLRSLLPWDREPPVKALQAKVQRMRSHRSDHAKYFGFDSNSMRPRYVAPKEALLPGGPGAARREKVTQKELDEILALVTGGESHKEDDPAKGGEREAAPAHRTSSQQGPAPEPAFVDRSLPAQKNLQHSALHGRTRPQAATFSEGLITEVPSMRVSDTARAKEAAVLAGAAAQEPAAPKANDPFALDFLFGDDDGARAGHVS